MSYAGARRRWLIEVDHLRSWITYTPAAQLLRDRGDDALREADAEIARLRIELDRYQGRTVLHCTDAQLDTAAVASLDEPPGTILRATDTGRELVLHEGTWEPATPV